METPQTRIVIAGGGVAGLEAALALRALAGERVSLELVTPEAEFVYRPLAVAEPFRVADVRRFPLRLLTEAAGATLLEGHVSEVDPDLHVVRTDEGQELPYDLLLLALGASQVEAVPGALTFGGPRDSAALAQILEEAVHGQLTRIIFALPAGDTWPMPLYELALLTRSYLIDRGTGGVGVTLVTPEERPLELFGDRASEAVAELLEARGIDVRLATMPLTFLKGTLEVDPPDGIEAERVIALPWPRGPALRGVPHDVHGFVPTDEHGAVSGEDDIFAAGDMTTFPVKQGGLATQQADAAAEAMAARAGVPLEPAPFRPVLRGLLLTGAEPRFLLSDSEEDSSEVDTEPLWWPPAKIVGKHLAPFLAKHLGLADAHPPTAKGGAVQVEVELDPHRHGVSPST